jgi:EF-P beta-lysylation protein EpmB
MIPRITSPAQPAAWQIELKRAVRDPSELLALLGLNPGLLSAARAAAAQFPLRVPRGFVARMQYGDPDDPLLRQVLPLGIELEQHRNFSHDPLGEADYAAAPGLLHKYQGRALLVTTGACAVHCRYCFRRHFPYTRENPRAERWQAALDYLRRDQSIGEIILSGGDPLSLSDTRLADLVTALETIPHIRRLRIHTRQPIVLPERVDEVLCRWLGACRLQKVIVVHANHAHEIDHGVEHALDALAACGARLFNQSVLLRGVNDSVTALAALSERLFAAGVVPYYLHQLDRVAGARHFEVPEHEARHLAAGLAALLPGYLVPRLVREVPGEPAKTPLPVQNC